MCSANFKLKLFRYINDAEYAFRFKNKTYFMLYFYSMSRYTLHIDFYNQMILYDNVLDAFRKYIRTGHSLTNKDYINKMMLSIQYDVLRPMFEDMLFIAENCHPI